MEERGGVLVQNEKHANKSVAKVMRITFLIFSIVFLLNVLGIFVVDMKIMSIAYILGSILLWVPTIIVNIAKLDGVYIKYMLAVCAVIFVTIRKGLIVMRETRILEFKETITNAFLKTVSAFSNYNGGTILFGVDDDGNVRGLLPI